MKSHCSKVIAKVKVDNKQTRQEDRQTEQKQYALDHLIRGIKMSSIHAASDTLDSHTSSCLWFTKSQ